MKSVQTLKIKPEDFPIIPNITCNYFILVDDYDMLNERVNKGLYTRMINMN